MTQETVWDKVYIAEKEGEIGTAFRVDLSAGTVERVDSISEGGNFYEETGLTDWDFRDTETSVLGTYDPAQFPQGPRFWEDLLTHLAEDGPFVFQTAVIGCDGEFLDELGEIGHERTDVGWAIVTRPDQA